MNCDHFLVTSDPEVVSWLLDGIAEVTSMGLSAILQLLYIKGMVTSSPQLQQPE